MGFLESVKDAFRGAGAEEQTSRDALDRPNLRQQVVAGILRLRQRGARGVDVLPPTVQVRIEVSNASLTVVRSFIDDPTFDADVEADLLNRLVGIGAEALPVRLYEVTEATVNRVTVDESGDGHLAWLEVEGGDRHGTWHALVAAEPECKIGRGPWHGSDELAANDLVVSDGDAFVSRRAAVLRRAGSGLEIEPKDQGDYLAVLTRNGKRIRPTHVRRGTVRVFHGDTIELNDGQGETIRVHIHARPPGGSAGERE